MKLYQTLAKNSDATNNVIVSPYSIAEALAMVRGGARANTATELDMVLNGGTAIDATTRKNLRENLLREQTSGSGTYVRVGNSIWMKNGYPIVPSFRELVAGPYNAKVESADFSGDAQGSAKRINSWISDTTEKQIENLVSPQDLNDLTRAVLVNAVLFHGKWFRPFNKSATVPAPFTVGGQSISVPSMQGIADVTPSKTASTVSLQYTGDYRMRIAMPANSSTISVDRAMASLFSGPPRSADGEQCEKINISLPKWKNETRFELVAPLVSLGIRDLFDPARSDLSGISPQAKADQLYIAKAIHKATVTVDEEGTIAAAATALFAEAASAPLRPETCPQEFKVNRPFAYVIQNRMTGEVLFAGRVMNPSLN